MYLKGMLAQQIHDYKHFQRMKADYCDSLTDYFKPLKDKSPDAYGDILQQIDLIRQCGRVSEVDENSSTFFHELCGDPFCPICIHERLRCNEMLCNKIIERNPGCYTFLYLMFPKCHPEYLKENIELLQRSLSALIDDSFSEEDKKFLGGVSRLSIDFDPDLQSKGLPSFKLYLRLFMQTTDNYYSEVKKNHNDDKMKKTPFISKGIRTQNTYTYKNGKWEIAYSTDYKFRDTSLSSKLQWDLRFKWQEITGVPLDPETLPLFCTIEPATIVNEHKERYISNYKYTLSRRVLNDKEQIYNKFTTGILLSQCTELPIVDYHGTWRESLCKIDWKDMFYNISR